MSRDRAALNLPFSGHPNAVLLGDGACLCGLRPDFPQAAEFWHFGRAVAAIMSPNLIRSCPFEPAECAVPTGAMKPPTPLWGGRYRKCQSGPWAVDKGAVRIQADDEAMIGLSTGPVVVDRQVLVTRRTECDGLPCRSALEQWPTLIKVSKRWLS